MSTPDRQAAARAIDAFLKAIGRDPSAEPDLTGSGARVADAFIDELCDGYDVDVAAVLRSNAIGDKSEKSGERSGPPTAIAAGTDLVIVRDIAVTTTCPHHLMPAVGR